METVTDGTAWFNRGRHRATHLRDGLVGGTSAGASTTSPAAPGTGPSGTVGTVTHFGIFAVEQAMAGRSTQFMIVALDAANHVVTDYTGTVHFTSTDGGATLPLGYTFTAAGHGSHAFSVTLATAGDQTLTAMDVTSDSFIAGAFQFMVV